jgi:plasmid stabilization system protein ParE
MAYQIVWTKQALKGYDKIINYLEENWSEKEILNFINDTDQFFETLVLQPEILQKSNKQKNLYRGPINRLTILIYRVKPLKKQIVLIAIRGARQKPLKYYPPL